MSQKKMRTLAEIPWLSLLPPEQRAGLESDYDDPDAAEWDALVAAERALESDLAGSDGVARMAKPLAAACVIAVMLLAVDAPSVAEQGSGSGGSNATASGTVTASADAVAARTAPDENRAALASRSAVEVAGTAAGAKSRNPRTQRGGKAPTAPSPPPPATGEQAPPPLASATLPVVGDVEVPAPKLEVPGVELPQLPQLPQLQLPQLPQLPPLPNGQQ